MKSPVFKLKDARISAIHARISGIQSRRAEKINMYTKLTRKFQRKLFHWWLPTCTSFHIRSSKLFQKRFAPKLNRVTEDPTKEKKWGKESARRAEHSRTSEAHSARPFRGRFGHFWLNINQILRSEFWVIKKWTLTFFSSLTFRFSSFHSYWWEQNTKLWGSWLNNKMKIWVLAAAVPGASKSPETVCITCIPLACLHS